MNLDKLCGTLVAIQEPLIQSCSKFAAKRKGKQYFETQGVSVSRNEHFALTSIQNER